MKQQPEKLAYLVSIKAKAAAGSKQSKLVMAIDKDHAKNAALILFNNPALTAADLTAKRV